MNISTSSIRKSFLSYFSEKKHKIIESHPLIPQNDDTLLFTNAGMVPFKNYFTGFQKPSFVNVATAQKCLRAGGKHNDLDNVGYTNRHHTFFEMLGNFSFDNYFKEQAILYAWDFLTKEIGLNKDKLVITTYHSDEEAFKIWKLVSGLSEKRIIKIFTKDNFWEMGDVGPCGPCSEIFYNYGIETDNLNPETINDSNRFIEIWNIVFMQHEKLVSGELINLDKTGIDTGMGLERISGVLQGKKDNYDIDLFSSIINYISEIFKVNVNQDNKVAFKVIADHLRAVSFMISEGILPSNEGRGYVLRRILRRAVRYAYFLGSSSPILYKLFPVLKKEMGNYYRELVLHEDFIVETIKQEEVKFYETFIRGIEILNSDIKDLEKNEVYSGKKAFKLYDTYGFPIDLTKDILRNKKIHLNEEEFDNSLQKHKELAKKSWSGSGDIKEEKVWFDLLQGIKTTNFLGYDNISTTADVLGILILKNSSLDIVNEISADSEGYIITTQTPFYAEMGGQKGDRGTIFIENNLCKVVDTQQKMKGIIVHRVKSLQGVIKVGQTVNMLVDYDLRQQLSIHHTATHILHSVLRNIFGNNITQQGSMINEDRLRFDVSHNKAISPNEIVEIEREVSNVILNNAVVYSENMDFSEAINKGARPLPGEKYPEIARTIKIPSPSNDFFSFELCGGTHVKSTGECGLFKIISESSIASGVRRIEAVSGLKALEYIQRSEKKVNSVATLLNTDISRIEDKIMTLREENKNIKKKLESYQSKYYNLFLTNDFYDLSGIQGVLKQVEVEVKELRKITTNFIEGRSNTFVYLVTQTSENKASFLLAISTDLLNTIDLKKLGKELFSFVGGSGGGKNLMIQGSGNLKSLDLLNIKNLFNKLINI